MRKLLLGSTGLVGMTLASPAAAQQSVNPAGGGTVTSSGSTVTGGGAGAGVRATGGTLVTVNNVAITQTTASPTINALDVSGPDVLFTGANSLSTTNSGGAAFNFTTTVNRGINLTGSSNSFTGSYGMRIAAPSGFVVVDSTGRTQTLTANGTAVTGFDISANVNPQFLFGTSVVSGFATGVAMTQNFNGGFVYFNSTGGSIGATSIGINANNAAGSATIESQTAITAPTGISATVGTGATITTSGGGTINSNGAGTGTGILTSGAGASTITQGAAIGTTASFNRGIDATATGAGTLNIASNAAITATGSGARGISATTAGGAATVTTTGPITSSDFGIVVDTGTGVSTVTVGGAINLTTTNNFGVSAFNVSATSVVNVNANIIGGNRAVAARGTVNVANGVTLSSNFFGIDQSGGGTTNNSGAIASNYRSVISSNVNNLAGGIIATTGQVANGAAIYSQSSGAVFTNAGTIGTGTVAGGVFTAGGAGDAIVVAASSNRIDNSGTITGAQRGIFQSNNSPLQVVNRAGTISGTANDGITASGVLTAVNARGATISSNTSSAVAILGSGSGTVTNGGTLSVGASGNNDFAFQSNTTGVVTFNNYGSLGGAVSFNSGALIINLLAGSTAGNIIGGSGNDTLTMYTGTGTGNTGTSYVVATNTAVAGVPTDATRVLVQNAGTLAAATVGAVNLGGGTDTLALRGFGDGTAANGAIGSFSIATSTGAEVLTKMDAGTWTLTGAVITPAITINAGDGGNNDGLLVFSGTTGLTGAINVNGAIIRSAGSGAFGTGTITTIDPTIQFAATTTETNNIVLASADPVGDPTILQTFGTGITATLTGLINQSGAPAQPLRFRSTDTTGAHNTGTFVLTNGGNDYAGLTTVETGVTIVQRDVGTALGSGGVVIATGATVQIDNQTGGALGLDGGTYSGAGTLAFTGNANSITDVGFFGTTTTITQASGGLFDVRSGRVIGSSNYQGFWTNNLGDLAVAAGASFATSEGKVRVDTLTGAGAVQIDGTGSLTLGVDNGTGTFTGTIADQGSAGALTKVGTGTQTLSGGLSYTGGTTISGGTLQLQNRTLAGGAVSVASGARLEYNLTGPGQINDGRYFQDGIVLTGTGVVAVTGTRNLSWRSTMQMGVGGELRVESGSFTGSSDLLGVWTGNQGNLFVASNALFSTSEAQTRFGAINGAGTIQVGAGGSLTFGVANATGGVFSGVIQNQSGTTGPLVKTGTGTQTLTGANTYGGATTISGGTLALTMGGSISNSALVTNNAIFDISGITAAGTSIVNLNGTATTANVALGARTLTITAGSGSYAGSITGTGGLTVNGTGTLQLTGTGNTYSGTTTIGAGETLQGTTATLSPNSTYVDNGILAFVQTASGTFGRNVSGTGGITVSGLAAGNTLTFTGALTQAGSQANGSPLRVLDSSNVTLAQGSSLIPVAAQNNAVSLLAAGTFTNLGTVNGSVGSQAIYSLNNTTGGGIINNGSAVVTGASLVGGDRGIFYSGGSASVTVNNYGLIQGGRFSGVLYSTAGTLTVNNNASGAIYGPGTASASESGVAALNGGVLGVTNAGQIVGQSYGVYGTAAADRVINTGTISSGSYTAPAAGAVYSTGTIAAGTTGTGIYLAQGGTVANAINATIMGGGTGLYSEGAGALNLTNNGTITGTGNGNGVGIFSPLAAAATITNTGTIAVTGAVAGNESWGVAFDNNGTVVANTGSIRGDQAIEAEGSGTIVNGATGTLAGLTNAIRTSGTGTLDFTNYGTTTGSILGNSSGVATIVLRAGSTTGAITTGAGNDTLTLYNGLVTTTVVTDPATGLTLRGAGTFAPAAVGTIDLGTGTNTLVLRGGGDDTAANGAAGTLDLSTVSNVSALTKLGSGIWTVTGAGTVGGPTSVNAGTLVVNATTASPTSVASGATLTGAGSIGATTVADGGILANTQGTTLTMASLGLSQGSVINATFNAPNGNPLFAVTGDLTLDGTVNVASTTPFGFGIYRLISYGGTLTDNGLVVGTAPAGAQRTTVQTSIAGQVNIVNSSSDLLYWDGGNPALYNNGAIDGGTGTWTATSPTFTDANGLFNGAMTPRPGFAIFAAAPGTVTVDGSAGAISVTDMQFASNGYVLTGDAIGLAAPITTIRVGDGTAAGAGYTATVTSVLTGANALDKTDLGTLILSGANSYTGPTTVSGGTLIVKGSTVSVTSVAAGATLRGTGSVGATTIADGGILVGAQGGTLTMASLGLSAGSIINATFTAPGGNPLFAVTGDLVLDGTVNVASTTPFGFGLYRLASYGGVLTDNGLVIGTTPMDAQRTTVQTAIAGQVNIVSSSSDLLYWDGGNPALYNNGAINGGTGTWTATSPTFADANGLFNGPMSPRPGFAIFAAAPGTVTVDGRAGAIAVTGLQFASNGYLVTGDPIGLAAPTTVIQVGDGTAAGAGFTATIAAALTGANALKKTDLGTLILSGTNSYTGATTVGGGTLVLAGGRAIDDGGAVQVDAGATLQLLAGERIASLTGTGNVALGANTLFLGTNNAGSTFGGVAAGTGGITQTGTGTLTLSGANSYTGTTSILGGTLVLAASNVLADPSTLFVQNGTVNLGANSDTVDHFALFGGTLNGTGTLTSTGASGITGYTVTDATINANLGTGSFGVGVGNTNTVLNGTVAAGVVEVGAGTLTLGASDRLADAATVYVDRGTILDLVANGDTVGSLILQGTLNGTGTLIAGSYLLESGTANANLGAGSLQVLGTGFGGNGESTLNGTAAATGVQVFATGTLTLGAANRLADGAAVSVASGGTLNLGTFSDTVGTLALNGTLAGTGTLTAASYTLNGGTANANLGTGTLTQAGGVSTLNGTAAATVVTINAGTLTLGAANRLADAAAVTVAPGGTLNIAGFADTVGTLALNGTLDGIGTLTAASYTLNGGTANANLGAGTLTQAGGTSTLNGSSAAATLNSNAGTLTLNGTSAATSVNVNGGTLALGAANRLADTAAVGVASGAVLDLKTFADTVGTLALNGTLNGSGTLTAASYTLNAATVNGNLGTGTLTQAGGTSVLTGTSGAATVNVQAGTLRLGADERLLDTGAVTIAGAATFDLGGRTETVASVNGAGTTALGTGRLVLAGAGGSSLGALTGTGNVDKTGTGTLVLANAYAAAGSINTSAGTTAFTGTSAGGFRVTGGSLTGTGNAAGALSVTGGTVAPGTAANPFGTLSVGSFAMTGGTYAIEFGGPASGYASDLIRVAGAASLGGAVSITNSGFVPTDRFQQTYTVVQAGSVAGTFSNFGTFTQSSTDPALFYRLRYDLVPNAVVLQVQRQVDFAAAVPGGTANQQAIGRALTGTAGIASDAFAATLNAIATSGGDRGATYDSLSGEAIADVTTGAMFVSDRFMDLIHARLGVGSGAAGNAQYALRAGSLDGKQHASGLAGALQDGVDANGGTAASSGGGVWLQGYGAGRRLRGQTGQARTDSFVSGLAGGFDGRFGALSVGVAGGVSDLDTRVRTRRSTVEGTLYQGGAYVAYDGGTFYGQVAGDYYGGDVRVTRQLVIGGTGVGQAQGSTRVHGYTVSGVLGARAELGGGTRAGIELAGQQTQAVRRAYTETAPLSLGLTAARDRRDVFTGTAQVKLSHLFTGHGWTAEPFASGGVQVNSGDLATVNAMQFGAAPTGTGGFLVQGAGLERTLGVFTGGIEIRPSDRFRLDLAAGGAIGNRTREGQIKVSARIAF